jgi:hypothetical protein
VDDKSRTSTGILLIYPVFSSGFKAARARRRN